MSLKEFAIELHPLRQVYYPGQDVTGNVVMTLDDPLEAKELKIRFMVKAQCRFSGKKAEHGSQTQIFSNDKMIVEKEECLLSPSPDSESGKISIPIGKHYYQFSFNIPTHIPSSFEGALGNIRYELKAQIGDDMVIRAITVNDIIDTNLPEYDICPAAESYADVGCLCVVRGTLHIKVHLDRGCYCPGEAILVTIQIGNGPTRNMSAVKAKLVQTIKYRTKNRTNRVDKVIATLKGPTISHSNIIVWDEQPFGIPAVAPSISNAEVIEVEYMVKIEIGIKCGKDIAIKVPIKIGTVPYLETYGILIENYGTPQDTKSPPNSNIINGPLPDISIFGYPGMVPPCYSAPIGQGEINICYEDDIFVHGETTYYPLYTFATLRELDDEIPMETAMIS